MNRGLIVTACMGLLCLGVNMAAAQDVVIRGKLKFADSGVVLPPGSTYRVDLKDVSRMDVASTILGSYSGNAEKLNDGEVLDFEIILPEAQAARYRRPFALGLSAVVNTGWARPEGSQEWIRRGDYLNDTMHFLDLSSGQHLIEDFIIEVKHYNH